MAEKSKQGTEEKRGSSSANQERETADGFRRQALTKALVSHVTSEVNTACFL